MKKTSKLEATAPISDAIKWEVFRAANTSPLHEIFMIKIYNQYIEASGKSPNWLATPSLMPYTSFVTLGKNENMCTPPRNDLAITRISIRSMLPDEGYMMLSGSGDDIY